MIELNVLNDYVIPLETFMPSGDGFIPLETFMPSSGGFIPSGTKQISITENGTTTEDVYSYADAEITVNVSGGAIINNQDKTVTPSLATQQVTADAGYTGLGTVTVEAMSSGSEGTPVATKGAVSNHAVDVTPSVTNTEGYIQGGTKTGTAVRVSASELVSGSETKTANGTYDVTNLASVVVDVDNSYTASDEGKVVDNGALVSQSSATYTENGTYDTTLVDDVTVSVSGGGGISIDEIADGSLTDDITITATNIREYAFRMTNVTGVTADNVTILRQQIFNQCTRLTKISFARAYTVNGSQQFLGCTNLTDINLPLLQTPAGNMFQACKALEFVDFPSITRMNFARLFYDCNKLKTIVLRHTSVVPLNNDVFTNTPFNGYGGLTGTVYVPSSLIESYKTATNWSTLYNNGTCNFVAIEGSEYE